MPNLKSAVRFDSMPMPRAYFTPEGYLRDRPVLTTCGIFEYTNPDGSVRRELRLPEDVFSPESLRSYKSKPVVITHEAGLIDKNNVAENQIGTILSEGERSGPNEVKAEIIIHDTDSMRKAGLKELSLGYNLDLDETPGTWNGMRYDAIQRNIRINHLALVREARAGEQARLNLDSRDQVNLLKGGRRMSKKTKHVPHADAVLSDEELDKALEEYDKKYGNKQPEAQVDADDTEEEIVEEKKTAEPAPEPAPAPSDEVEEKVEMVKARRDRRDEEGDPEDVDSAMGMIAHQDEDIDSLLDIIDTLRAKLDFNTAKDAAEEEPVVEEQKEEEEIVADSVDDLEKLKGDADDEEVPPEEEEEEFATDADDEEEEEEEDLLLDSDDEEVPEEEEVPEDEFEEDADDEEEEEEEELALDGEDCDYPEKRMNADSVDRLVNQKIALGELGEMVGLRGLARKPVRDAKKAIIRAVNPKIRLDGKSDTYLNVAFKMAKDEIKARSVKTTAYQKKQMFNKDSADRKRTNMSSAEAARERMIARQSNKSN